MDREYLEELLTRVKDGELAVEEALEVLRDFPYADTGFAAVDSHRPLRTGYAEVVFCQGKTPAQVVAITEKLVKSGLPVLATRATPETYSAVLSQFPNASYNEPARTITIPGEKLIERRGAVAVVTAGTADIRVAEEAAATAEFMGCDVNRFFDVGVAGLHRILDKMKEIRHADAVVVAAGMEGALPSVVGGMVDVPVIAVPTSVGYGASFGGIAALLGMLNSCANGVVVVNIDNGYGAGYTAALIARRAETK
ncbi:MAG: nickel pincer cofactor biosynthesis protein LarB [Candidatus Coatesbacteria bacterium]|nr:MAG: nickel pincer cofactor biosynthesis protein LarB [Candidatus Coatesbacteria bacterium]